MHGIGPGTVLAQRYTAQRRLAQMRGAERWSAQDQTLEREVELLCFPATHEHAEAAVDAARRAAGLDNPRLVRVLDVGVWDGLAFVVEESLHGAHTLTSLLAQGGLPAEEVRRLVGETATALDSASQRGLHHLMLSPSQILRTHDGSVKVAGLAVAAALTGSDDVESDEASRIDAVGAVALAYAGLTSRWPLDTDSGGLERTPRVVGGVPAPSEIAAGVPSDLDALCRLTLNRNQGPVSPGDFAAQIAPWSLTQIGRLVQAPAAASPAPRFGMPSRLRASVPEPPAPEPPAPEPPVRPEPARPAADTASTSATGTPSPTVPDMAAVSKPVATTQAESTEEESTTGSGEVDEAGATSVPPASTPAVSTAPASTAPASTARAAGSTGTAAESAAKPVARQALPTDVAGPYSEEPTVAHHSVRPPVGLSSEVAAPGEAGAAAPTKSTESTQTLAPEPGEPSEPSGATAPREGGKTLPDERDNEAEPSADVARPVSREQPSGAGLAATAAGTTLAEQPGAEPDEKAPAGRSEGPSPQASEMEAESPDKTPRRATWAGSGSAHTEVLSPVPPTSSGADRTEVLGGEPDVAPTSVGADAGGRESHSDKGAPDSVSAGSRAEPSALTEGKGTEGSGGDHEAASVAGSEVKTEQFRWPTWTDPNLDARDRTTGEPEGSAAGATAAAVAGAVGTALGAAGHAAGAVSDKVGLFAKAAAERAAERRAYRQAEEEEAERHRISLDQALLGAHEDLEPPLPMLPAETAAAPTRRQSNLALLIVAGFVVIVLLVGLFGASRIGASSEGDVPSAPATTRTVAVTAPPQTVTVAPSTSAVTEDSSPEKLAFLSASGFDPQGDGRERNGEAGRVWDGKASTYWSSEGYQTPDMGGLKDGAGVILDFGQTVKPSEVGLLLPDPATFDLYLAPDRSLDGATKVGSSSDKSGEISIKVSGGASGQYLIVWFTRVSRVSDGAYRATLAEVTAKG